MKHHLLSLMLMLLAVPVVAQAQRPKTGIVRHEASDQDVEVSFYRVDTVGSVNHPVNATITISNNGSSTLESDAWKAYLYAGGNAVATVSTISISSGYYANFDVAFTPHETGTLPLQAVFISGTDTIRTEAVNVVIGEETAEVTYQIGENDGTQSYAPIQMGYENSESESVYSAAELGLKPGQQITKLVYRGNSYGNELNSLKVWLQNTDVTEPADTFTNVDSMTAVFDAPYTVPEAGDSYDPADLLTLPLQEPFTYTGGNLRVRFRHSASGYASAYFVRSATYGSTINHRSINPEDLDGATVNTTYNPVVWLSVATEPATISGNVTDKDGKAVEGAEIKLTSGDVEYSGVTAADGAYSVKVIQNALPYELTATLAGYVPHTDSVRFDNGDITRDIVLQRAEGLAITSSSLPAEGNVNSQYAARLTVTNYTADAIAASDWSATLTTVEGDTLATAAGVDVAAGQSADITLSFVPHAVETLNLTASIAGDGFASSTDETAVEIQAEQPDIKEKQVDESLTTNYYNPFDLYRYHSTSQTIYKADQIGLPENTRITAFNYRGYNNNDNEFDFRVRMFVENTTDTLPDDEYDFVPADTATMTKVFDGNVHMERKGARNEFVDMLPLQLAEPFVYTGGNIRVVLVHDADAKSSGAYFECDNRYQTYRASSDYDTEYATDDYIRNRVQPVIHLSIDNSRVLTGVVTDSATAEPVAGAVVTLTSGDIIYTATTAEDGTYTVNVMKGMLDYLPSATADGYDAWTGDSLSLAENDSTLNIVLAKQSIVNAINSVSVSSNANVRGIYDLQGRQLSREATPAAIARLPKGVYIINGKKFAR